MKAKGKEAGTSVHLRNGKQSSSAGAQLCKGEQWETGWKFGLESSHRVPWMPCKGIWTVLASNEELLKVFE